MNAAVSSDLSTGTVFAGRYRVERCIAAGGMGAVYEVVHIETNRRRALKVMHAHYVSNDELRGRFRQEARVAAEIESEHIVDVFDAGIDEATGMPFLVMELLRGEDLRSRLKRIGSLPKEEALQYLYEASLALDKTHHARIVHRDLKPDNLFLCERAHGAPIVKVLDFGIAKIVSDASTQANATSSLGTPLYMAPEQFVLKGGVSPATDIFALGMIAYTLLVGKPYWYDESKAGGGLMAFAMHVATGTKDSAVGRAKQYGVELPLGFDGWFFRATSREPAARFASAGEAVRALAEVFGLPMPAQGAAAYRASTTAVSVLDVPAPFAAASAAMVGTNHSYANGPSNTGPTQMGMSPGSTGSTSMFGKTNPNSRLLVVGASVGTLVLGLAILLVVKGFSGSSEETTAEAPEARRAAAGLAMSNAAVVQPAVAVAAPSSSAASSLSETNVASETAKPRTSANAVTKPAAVTAPAATTATTAGKPRSRGTWEAD
ncbi:MAG TPA: serine/threonine-protein kinase [Polyangium sp.]|nr:serine/threonine-protein kinase [Polyangium sp.]